MFGGGNNPVVDIGISMTLQDRFSGPAGNVLSSWKGMLSDMSNYSNGIQQAFTNSINRNADYLKSMYSAYEYSTALQKNTFLTSKMMKNNRDTQFDFLGLAQEINERNPLTAMDITSGEKFMAMAGMTADHIKNAAEPAAQLAAIFSMDMGGKGGTADLLTNIMATFQLGATEASHVADILSVGTTSANMSMADLAQSIKYVGANAKMAGMDISEVTAAIGVLGNYGIQGSMAGTNLGQALNTMNKAITGASDKGANALKALGLSPEELQTAEGNLIPIHDILVKIANASKNMGQVQKQGILFNLFGMRGLRAMVPLLEDISSGANKFEGIMNNLKGSDGWLQRTTEQYMESPEGRIKALTSAWENFIVTTGATLSQIFSPVLKFLTWITRGLNYISGTFLGGWLIKGLAIHSAFRLIRSTVGLISFGMKGIATNLLTSRTGATSLANGLRVGNIQAAQLETHLRNITILLASQSLASGQSIRLWGGTAYRNKNGVLGFRPGKGSGLGGTFFRGPIIMGGFGAGGTGIGGVGGTATKFGTPLYRSVNSMMPRFLGTAGRGTAVGLARVGAGITGGFGKLFGFLMGPWGMAISLGATFIPMIWDWLTGSKEEDVTQQEDLDARQAARDAEIVRAIREGRGASVNVNLNGNPVGTFMPGDTANLDLFAGDDQYGMNF